MKVVIIIYHSEIIKKYKYEWILKFFNSLKNQTFQDFDLVELNYNGDKLSILHKLKLFQPVKYTFINKKMENHIIAQNYLFDYCFNKNYDVVFNTNIDDYYDHTLLEKEVNLLKNNKIDIISSNFTLVQNINNSIIRQKINILKTSDFDKQQNFLKSFFSKNDSKCFQLSGACITKNFYLKSDKKIFENYLLLENLFMCKKMILKSNFYIIQEYLISQRIHDEQLSYNYR